MVVLFIAHHIYHLIDGIILITQFGSAYILSHIHRSAVAAEQQLMVEAVGCEVGPHRVILAAIHNAFFESFEHFFLAFEISVAFVVNLIEIHAHALVGGIKSGIHPFVHHSPHAAHFFVAGFPLLEHLAGFLHQRRFGFGGCLAGFHSLVEVFERYCENLGVIFHYRFHFGLIVLVEEHIEVAYQVVALLTCLLGCDAVAPLLPCEHRLADVYTAVVHYIGLHHLIAVGFHYLREAVAEEIVANVAQVEGLIGVWRRIFYHHQFAFGSFLLKAIIGVGCYVAQHRCPERWLDNDIQKSLDDIK